MAQNQSTQKASASQTGTAQTAPTEERYENTVRAVGYLRETTLEHKNVGNMDVIAGSVTIAFNEDQSIDIRYYVPKFQKDRVTPNKAYDEFCQFVQGADGCVSIGQLFKAHRVRSFEEAVNGVPEDAAKGIPAVPPATKVRASGEIGEHLYVSNAGERRSVTRIRGRFLHKFRDTEGDSFFPMNQFCVQGYVISNTTDDSTGRVSVVLGIPAYDKSVSKIAFVTPLPTDKTPIAEGHTAGEYSQIAADAVSAQYVVGSTVSVVGYVGNTRTELKAAVPQAAVADPFFGAGQGASKSYGTTVTVHENVVYAGDPNHLPLTEGEPGAITKQDIKDGLALKEAIFQEYTDKKGTQKRVAPTAAPAAAGTPAAPKGFKGFGFASANPANTQTGSAEPIKGLTMANTQPKPSKAPTASLEAPEAIVAEQSVADSLKDIDF